MCYEIVVWLTSPTAGIEKDGKTAEVRDEERSRIQSVDRPELVVLRGRQAVASKGNSTPPRWTVSHGKAGGHSSLKFCNCRLRQ
ncbi:uncharacterized protein HHUB_1192 [Halobacterium hubeiense]|uniref:Uncharacterized protein n=1 Tax=Halobacterium hubeiense TaxID=1407499 RepID=A0A0U5AAD1_9EURY|nr:uncharacterized protein HHUB_1192 [Halobacterium hubeiense]